MNYCICFLLFSVVTFSLDKIFVGVVAVVVSTSNDNDDSDRTETNISWDDLDMYSRCRKRPTWRLRNQHEEEGGMDETDFAEQCAKVMEWEPRAKYWNHESFNWFTVKDKEEEIMEDHDYYDDEDRENFQQGGMELIMRKCVDKALETELEDFLGTADYRDLSSRDPNKYDVVKKPSVIQKFNYDNTPNETALVQIEAALTNEEALAVQAVAFCVREYFEGSNFEFRSFAGDYPEKNDADGNHCTYMDHFMQVFAPGVSAQIKNVAYLAWQAADGWIGKYEDPKTLGIRTTEHLHYKEGGHVSFHDDPDSVYTIVASLRRPEEYIGGELLVADWEEAEMQRVFKGPRLSAVVFVSEELLHAVGSVTGGRRDTFATELWVHDDVPYGLNGRPSPGAWSSFLETWNVKDINENDSNENKNGPQSEL